jgi:flagellar motor component MotA
MKASTQFGGVLIVLAVVFGIAFAPGDPAVRALLAALAIVVGGGTMAFLRSRELNKGR